MRTVIALLGGTLVVLAGGQAMAHGEGSDPASVAYGEAQLALGERDCGRAVRHLRQVLVLQPDRWDVHRLAADCLMKLDRPVEALTHYREWLRARPEDAAAAAGARAAEERQRADDERRDARDREREIVERKRTQPSLASLAREQGGRKTTASTRTYVLNGTGAMVTTEGPAPDWAPASVLDTMRQRAEFVLRPAMSSIAIQAKQLAVARRRYTDACAGKTRSTTTDGVRQGRGAGVAGPVDVGSGGGRIWSEWAWVEQWRARDTQRNEETVECRTIASDIDRLSENVGAVLDGCEQALAEHPAVYRGIREDVFSRLAGELW